MKTRQLILSGLLFLAGAGHGLPDTSTSLLLPKPHQMAENGSSFSLNRTVVLNDPTTSTLLASLFKTDAPSSATVSVNLVDASTLGTFDYTLAGFDNEGYKLEVNGDAITITAATKTGVIRAAQTLAQLAAATDGTAIPGVSITDYPAFKLRGFMHDVGRSFISVDELKREIDLLSRFKVNAFHWHLTDNQGFRFESKVYPQLNQASAMTRFAGNYYTQAECTEVEAYAAERGMAIIPEIDMPGHSTAFTTAMGYTMSSTQGRAALKNLLKELAEAFPLAPYIHMGADEAGTTAEFVNEMSQYIKETLGRRCVVWNPISGVSITTANLPYIDMTEMWSTAGKKIDGLPNIDCRYNYVNHFDVFADLVGIYKSNIYYAQQGNPELAGAITAVWNDRKTPTETDIVRQNNLYANALATAERGWMGGGRQYIEVGGTTLPSSGKEYEEFADWERRFLHYKDTWLRNEPIPYVRQTDVRWRITDAFPNGGEEEEIHAPSEATDDILPETFTYRGKTYGSQIATGAAIYLRHTWGTTVPGLYASPALNTTAYAWTYVYSPVAQEAGALIELQNYSRSENDRAPDIRLWDRKGSHIYLNGEELMPPTWSNAGKTITSEVDLGNENFTAREPLRVQLHAGWNKVFLKLPYVAADGVRLNKWMFTFVLTDPTGRDALDGIIYSPSQSMDPTADIPVELSSEPLEELTGYDISVAADAAASLTTGQWYVMFDRGKTGSNPHGYLYERVGSHTLFNTATVPTGRATAACHYLVRLKEAADGKFYVQTGYGNYFGAIEHRGNVAVTATPSEAITIAKIGGTDGHFYLQSEAGVILDANSLENGDATVVGWGTNVPTTTGGNNDWAFYPVELVDNGASNPTVALLASDVAVARAYQTAGRGNTRAALLRINFTPIREMADVALHIALDEAGAAAVSGLTLYEAASDTPEFMAQTTLTELATTTAVSADTRLLCRNTIAATPHYLWLCATIRDDAPLGTIITPSLTAITYTCGGKQTTLNLSSVGSPSGQGVKVFGVQSYPFLPTTYGSGVYRIPALIMAADGSLVAAADKRYGSYTDIGGGHVIDIVVRRSTDGGRTWSEPLTVAKGQGVVNGDGTKCGYGDPSLTKGKDGRLYCLFAAGNVGYFYGLNRIAMCTSDDNGVTWSPVVDLYGAGRITDHTPMGLYDYFVTSGKGLYTQDGVLMYLIPAQPYTAADKSTHQSNSNDYIFYSTDDGQTWHFDGTEVYHAGDEAKLVQLADGSLVGSVRQGNGRGFNFGTYTKNDDGTLSFQWGAQYQNGTLHNGGSANNQDILRYRLQGDDKTDVLIHSMTIGSHANLNLYMSIDGGRSWKHLMQVQPGGARYVVMTQLPNGDLGLLFEDYSLGAGNQYPLNFLTVARDEILMAYEEAREAAAYPVVCIVQGNTTETTFGTWDSSKTTWTSTVGSNPVAGLTLSKSAGTFDKYTGWNGHFNLAYKVGAANRDEELTLTAPEGFLIQGYSLLAAKWSNASHTYMLTAEDGTTVTTASGSYSELTVSDLNVASTTIKVRSNSTSYYLAIADFTVQLVDKDLGVGISQPQDLPVPSVSPSEVYDLSGRRVSQPLKGLYVKGGKKVIIK